MVKKYITLSLYISLSFGNAQKCLFYVYSILSMFQCLYSIIINTILKSLLRRLSFL